jgi:hypothetical protein
VDPSSFRWEGSFFDCFHQSILSLCPTQEDVTVANPRGYDKVFPVEPAVYLDLVHVPSDPHFS